MDQYSSCHGLFLGKATAGAFADVSAGRTGQETVAPGGEGPAVILLGPIFQVTDSDGDLDAHGLPGGNGNPLETAKLPFRTVGPGAGILQVDL